MPPFQRVVIATPLKNIFNLSLQLLDNEAKKHERTDQYACKFEYVSLKRDRIDFKPFFDLIDRYAGYYGMKAVYPRITRFNSTDFMSVHSDTVEAQIACSIRLDEGISKLYILSPNNEWTRIVEGNHTLVVFDPKVPHYVEMVSETDKPRVVINFWLQ